MILNKTLSTALIAVLVLAAPVAAFAKDHDHKEHKRGEFMRSLSDSSLKVKKDTHLWASTGFAHASLSSRAQIDARINQLEDLIDRIEDSSRLSDEQKDAAIDRLEVQISALKELRAKVGEKTSDSEKEKIKDRMKNGAWHMTKAHVIAMGTRIDGVIDRLEDLTPRLEDLVEGDASLEADLEIYVDELASARAHVDAAVDLADDVNDDGTITDAERQKLTDARAELKAARQDLKDAREMLRSILNEVFED